MASYDLIVKGGTVATAADTFDADIGIKGGRIIALADELSDGEVIDARGKLVLPGGVDSHCHIMTVGDNERGSQGLGEVERLGNREAVFSIQLVSQ